MKVFLKTRFVFSYPGHFDLPNLENSAINSG
jgi:hypothetical protein